MFEERKREFLYILMFLVDIIVLFFICQK